MVNLYQDLSELGLPVFVEGSAPETLPERYYTFSEDYTDDDVCADNVPKSYLYEFTIKYYDKDASRIYQGMIDALTLLRSKKYIVSGVGYHNPTYQNTWFSRQADVKKIEYPINQ